MEKHLYKDAEFSAEDLAKYFADQFTIITNGRVLDRSPEAYREYLYGPKRRLNGYTHAVDEMIEVSDALITPFTITMDLVERGAIDLLAISIFKFDQTRRITQ